MAVDLFELAEERATRARAARDEAIDQVAANAEPDEKEVALRAVKRAIVRWPDGFTTDDLQALVGPVFREPRAWGAVMKRAQKMGLCSPSGEYRQSTSARCHARPKMVWRRGND